MGREIKRVTADFDWPLNKVWEGFLEPENLRMLPCPDCRYGDDYGTGYSPEANAIASTFYAHMIEWGNTEHANRLAWNNKLGQKEVDYLVKHDRLGVWVDGAWTHPPRTAEEINRENDRPGINGHDAINRMLLVEFRCKRLGINIHCATCKGETVLEKYVGQKADIDGWEATEPPSGDWWQLWETVSEGSPVSPAFETPEGLARHISSTSTTSFADALKWVTGSGWAPSMVFSGGVLRSNIEAAVALDKP